MQSGAFDYRCAARFFPGLPFNYLRSVICMQIADYNEANNMVRMEATLAAVMNFLGKIGSALGRLW